MAMTSYMTLEGKQQGNIEGDCDQSGREGAIVIYAIEHDIEIPRDTHTGLPTGQRIHHPLKVTKHFDKATPQLYQACTSGEQFKEVEIKYFRINEKGQEEHYFTVKLEDAILVSIQARKPLTILAENKPYHDMQTLQFSYSKIIWTYEPDGIETEDSWKEPKA